MLNFIFIALPRVIIGAMIFAFVFTDLFGSAWTEIGAIFGLAPPSNDK